MTKYSGKYDLEARTTKFGEKVIGFAGKITRTPVTISLISQLVRAGTSVGANYCEADDSLTRKEFIHKISICKKESRETKYWLIMVTKAIGSANEIPGLMKEAEELNRIFAAIIKKCRLDDQQ